MTRSSSSRRCQQPHMTQSLDTAPGSPCSEHTMPPHGPVIPAHSRSTTVTQGNHGLSLDWATIPYLPLTTSLQAGNTLIIHSLCTTYGAVLCCSTAGEHHQPPTPNSSNNSSNSNTHHTHSLTPQHSHTAYTSKHRSKPQRIAASGRHVHTIQYQHGIHRFTSHVREPRQRVSRPCCLIFAASVVPEFTCPY